MAAFTTDGGPIMQMNRRRFAYTAASLLATFFITSTALARNEPGVECKYKLDRADSQPTNAKAEIHIKNETELRVKLTNASKETLYTVWIDFRTRPDKTLPGDFPTEVGVQAVLPAMAITDGVTNGIGLDVNAIVTDEDGDGSVKVHLDFEILQPYSTPVVGGLAMQGMNRVGGFWMRQYPADPSMGASLQKTDPETGLPLVVRNTSAGITIVGHPDYITHGHTPGVGGVDHFSAFSGNFPGNCMGGV